MKTEHTPGPWAIGRNEGGGNCPSEQRHELLIHPASGPYYTTSPNFNAPLVASLKSIRHGDRCDGYTYATTEANARLIAAAPDLLAELSNLADAAALVGERWERGDLADAVRGLMVDLSTARAAIAKATGAAGAAAA